MRETAFIFSSFVMMRRRLHLGLLVYTCMMCGLMLIGRLMGVPGLVQTSITFGVLGAFLTGMYLCVSFNWRSYELHMLSRGVARGNYYVAGFLFCMLPFLQIVIVGIMAWGCLCLFSAKPMQDCWLVLPWLVAGLLSECLLALAIIYCFAFLGFRIWSLVCSGVPFYLGLQAKLIPGFFVSYACLHGVGDIGESFWDQFAFLGGGLHIVENLIVAFLVFFMVKVSYQNKDLG